MEGALAGISCDQRDCIYQAGFVDVRGVKVVFTRTVCDTVSSSAPFPPPNDEVFFYDCAGNLLELANKHPDEYTTLFGGISEEDFSSLDYDVRWTCFQEVELLNAVEEPSKDVANSNSSIKVLQCAHNPVDVLLTCEKEEEIKPGNIAVFDLMGGRHVVQYQIWNERVQLDMNHLPPGIYIISIQGEKARYVAKIVLE